MLTDAAAKGKQPYTHVVDERYVLEVALIV